LGSTAAWVLAVAGAVVGVVGVVVGFVEGVVVGVTVAGTVVGDAVEEDRSVVDDPSNEAADDGVWPPAMATVDRTLTPALRPAWVGNMVQSTASARNAPIAPVAAVSPRPMVSGGSLVAQAFCPISLGCRHGRSCAGRGARGYSSSSFPSLRSTSG
jgi:hypothetical protein